MQIVQSSVWQDFIYKCETTWKNCHLSFSILGLTETDMAIVIKKLDQSYPPKTRAFQQSIEGTLKHFYL